jgi:predicted CoA-binding protein
VVIFVVPPQVTEKVLEEVRDLWIKNVRMQPGAQSSQAISFCEKCGINCVHDACIMIQRNSPKGLT